MRVEVNLGLAITKLALGLILLSVTLLYILRLVNADVVLTILAVTIAVAQLNRGIQEYKMARIDMRMRREGWR